MSSGLDYGLLQGGADEAGLAAAQAYSFQIPEKDVPGWWERAGRENVRVVKRDGRVAGGLVLIPMGQFFGGRSVAMAGVAGVAVPPEQRGRGVAGFLMEQTLRELAGQGFALSALYAATVPLYRKVGYELAGSLFTARALLRDLPRRPSALAPRPAASGDARRQEELYREFAAAQDGMLNRGPYLWKRIRSPRTQTSLGWVVEGAGGVEGYLYLAKRPVSSHEWDVELLDWVAATPGAADALISLLAGEHSLSRWLSWPCGPSHPLLLAVQERGGELSLTEPWMLRVLDVRAALEQRGYPSGLAAELHFELSDPLLAHNAGRFLLRVAGGRGQVQPGGRGGLRLDAASFAPLYTGYLSAERLTLLGRCSGSAAELAAASAVFRSTPSMVDMF